MLSLTLTDPRFYHLDTAIAVLDDNVMYYPRAFSTESRKLLRNRFPHAILADDEDAEAFGLNAVSDGLHVVLPRQAVRLADQLADRGYEPIGVDVSELLKAGGGVKCCTLQLPRPTHGGTATTRRPPAAVSLARLSSMNNQPKLSRPSPPSSLGSDA